MSEDRRVKQPEGGQAPLARHELRERLPGSEGDAVRDAPLEEKRGSGQARDGADLRELVQDEEILGGVLLRKAAHLGVGAGTHGHAGAHRLVGVGRFGPCEAEGVVAERDLVEPSRQTEGLVLAEAVLEKVDGRGVSFRRDRPAGRSNRWPGSCPHPCCGSSPTQHGPRRGGAARRRSRPCARGRRLAGGRKCPGRARSTRRRAPLGYFSAVAGRPPPSSWTPSAASRIRARAASFASWTRAGSLARSGRRR